MLTASAAYTVVTLTLDGKEARGDVINLCNSSQLGRQGSGFPDPKRVRTYGVTSVSDKFLEGHRKKLSRVVAEDYSLYSCF